MAENGLDVVILGPTTVMGRELVPVLRERGLQVGRIRLLGEEEEVGEEIEGDEEGLSVERLEPGALAGADVVFVPPNVQVPKEIRAAAVKAGALVVDASGEAADAPLIFPGINDEELEELESIRGTTIAVPSAAAAQLAAVLLPLEAKAGLSGVHVVSLEAVSTFGVPGMEELSMQTVSLLNGREPDRALFPHRIAFNLVPQMGAFEADGATSRERRLEKELERLLDKKVPVAVSCALVPVFYGTTQFLTVTTERELGAAGAREALEGGDSTKILDAPEENVYPMPMLAVGDESLHVGRIHETPIGLSLLSVADNLRWGTVVPMVRIVEALVEAGRLERS